MKVEMLLLLLVVGSSGIFGCASQPTAPAPVIVASEKNPSNQRQSFIASAEQQQEEWDRVIADLRRKTQSPQNKGKGIDGAALFLETHKREVQEDLGKLRLADDKEWQKIQERIQVNLNSMSKRYAELRSELRE